MPYKEINLISIQHNGTRLLAEKFNLGNELALKDWETQGFHVGHISEGLMPYIMKLIRKPTIIPIRHPYLVCESWQRKGKSIQDLVKNYHYLIDIIDKFNPFYVNIDLELRNSQIDKINSALDLTLPKNWPIINSKSGTYDMNPDKLMPSTSIIEMMERNRAFFANYCRETAGNLNGTNY